MEITMIAAVHGDGDRREDSQAQGWRSLLKGLYQITYNLIACESSSLIALYFMHAVCLLVR